MSYMNRTILTTCGTSLFQTSCWKYKGLNDKYPSQMEDKAEREAYERKCEAWLVRLARGEDEGDLPSSFDRTSWDNLSYLRDLPAELASLRVIKNYFEKHGEPLGKGDKIILLHSDNDDGKYCAEMIHKVLTDEESKLLHKVEIDEWEVKGLDPTDFEEFGRALSDIWQESIQRFPRDKDTQYIFNLTGGYKGVAILLGAFAELKGLDTRIFYLYEEANYEAISVMYFDPNSDIPEFSIFKTGYFNASTGEEYNTTITDEEFN